MSNIFDVKKKEKNISLLEQNIKNSKNWINYNKGNNDYIKIQKLKIELLEYNKIKNQLIDLKNIFHISNSSYYEELIENLNTLSQSINIFNKKILFYHINDKYKAIISIHAGAGGKDASDWAYMLMNLYLKWAKIKKITTYITDITWGEDVGINNVTIEMNGEFAYGYLKTERGVHRLVRISPFDSNKRRHTSFCAVDVIAQIPENKFKNDFDFHEKDLKIDTFKASGSGGQSVNKTESAVRVTHLKTNTVVTCQNERSQYQNKTRAIKILKYKLYEKFLDSKRSLLNKFYGEKGNISWGNQIRNYIMHPYKLVKDIRTNTEINDIDFVLNGNIDIFINEVLKQNFKQNN